MQIGGDEGVTRWSVVILSAKTTNLRGCIRSLIANEPGLTPDRIVVVDDGARASCGDLPVRWVEGKKPFIFARNANLGIAACGKDDVVLMNDDAELATIGGFSKLHERWSQRPNIAAISPVIDGIVGNPNQRLHSPNALRQEFGMLCFVCVYLPRRAISSIGLLDERFTGYGYDDSDWCRRATLQGWDLWIDETCVVRHERNCTSTYRTRPDIAALSRASMDIYNRKWPSGD